MSFLFAFTRRQKAAILRSNLFYRDLCPFWQLLWFIFRLVFRFSLFKNNVWRDFPLLLESARLAEAGEHVAWISDCGAVERAKALQFSDAVLIPRVCIHLQKYSWSSWFKLVMYFHWAWAVIPLYQGWHLCRAAECKWLIFSVCKQILSIVLHACCWRCVDVSLRELEKYPIILECIPLPLKVWTITPLRLNICIKKHQFNHRRKGTIKVECDRMALRLTRTQQWGLMRSHIYVWNDMNSRIYTGSYTGGLIVADERDL